MTVNELLQRLVELAAEGKAQWIVHYEPEMKPEYCIVEQVELDEETKGVYLI